VSTAILDSVILILAGAAVAWIVWKLNEHTRLGRVLARTGRGLAAVLLFPFHLLIRLLRLLTGTYHPPYRYSPAHNDEYYASRYRARLQRKRIEKVVLWIFVLGGTVWAVDAIGTTTVINTLSRWWQPIVLLMLAPFSVYLGWHYVNTHKYVGYTAVYVGWWTAVALVVVAVYYIFTG
jgi:hypothetical protein